MINIRKAFSNKHRAYLLIFVCAYLALRLPILVANKIERVIIGAVVNQSARQGLKTAYKGFKYSFPANVNFEQLIMNAGSTAPIEFNNLSLSTGLTYPLKISFSADIFKGTISCNFTKGLFSSELAVSCNSNNFETSALSYFEDFGVNGPLSFKFSGITSTNSSVLDINGEFLSQLDSSSLHLPKEIPSIIKIPNLGILDLKGNFNLKNNTLSLKETSIASTAGDVDINLNTEISPQFKELVSLDALLKLKLSSNGMQTLAPWIGLALGGIEYPASGQANIEVKGNSRLGFRGKLVN